MAVFCLLAGCQADDSQNGNADGSNGKKPGASKEINGSGLNIELRQPRFDQKLVMPDPGARQKPPSPLDF